MHDVEGHDDEGLDDQGLGARLWQVIDLPGATLLLAWDERALIERPWAALELLALSDDGAVMTGAAVRPRLQPVNAGSAAR